MKQSPFAKMRKRRHQLPAPELALAAMVDMMINILIFLLFLYGSDPLSVPLSDEMQLAPTDASEQAEAISVPVVVSTKTVWVADKPILRLTERGGKVALPEGSLRDGALPELIVSIREGIAARVAADAEASTELVIQTDRRIPWSVLGPVVRSGALAGADSYRFIARGTGPDAT